MICLSSAGRLARAEVARWSRTHPGVDDGRRWALAQRVDPFAGQRLGDSQPRPPVTPITSRCDRGEPPRVALSGKQPELLRQTTRRSAERASTEVREGAMCVQRLDDSLNSAIRTTYRSSLRSSSKHEPRGPPLEVVLCFTTSLHHSSSTTHNSKRQHQCQQGCRARPRPPRRAEATTTAEEKLRYFFSSTADTDPVHKTRQEHDVFSSI